MALLIPIFSPENCPFDNEEDRMSLDLIFLLLPYV